jgi:hypothetical protein
VKDLSVTWAICSTTMTAMQNSATRPNVMIMCGLQLA